VIHNGIRAARFAADTNAPQTSADETNADPARSSSRRGVAIGMLGRVGTWKGQELLLDAAAIVCRENPDTHFVLAGGVLDGNISDLRALEVRARDLGIADRVAIQEYCYDVPEFLRKLDVFVQPSLRPDPLPTTILEAMASGKPVVAAAHGGASEMVVDGVTGVLTPPGDASALANAILRLVRDPAARSSMGAAGRERVTREFSPARFTAGYLQAYRELAAAQRRPAN
jgi:glycosyltransferase involved in cell wall biosynthesis